jgi:Ni,Fe-hydrogenase I cytochrome b subunit
MFVSLAMSFVPMSGALNFVGLFGGNFYASFPLSLPLAADGEPAFTLSAAFVTVRVIYFVAGMVLLAISVRRIQIFGIKKDGKDTAGCT